MFPFSYVKICCGIFSKHRNLPFSYYFIHFNIIN